MIAIANTDANPVKIISVVMGVIWLGADAMELIVYPI
jgi:hypothetical protein